MARLAHARGGAQTGPAGAVAAMKPRARVRVSGWLYPGGAEIAAPTAADPHWRGPDGRAHDVGELLGGQSEATRRLVLAMHADALAEIVRLAAGARSSGEGKTVRPAVAAASRLLHQLVGQGAGP
jgi:hypothetical protein